MCHVSHTNSTLLLCEHCGCYEHGSNCPEPQRSWAQAMQACSRVAVGVQHPHCSWCGTAGVVSIGYQEPLPSWQSLIALEVNHSLSLFELCYRSNGGVERLLPYKGQRKFQQC